MKKLLLSTSVACVLGLIQPANALVVSDPGQYARMSTELNELKKQFDVLENQLDSLRDIQSSVNGNLKRGKGIFRDLGRLQDLAEDMTNGLHSLPHMDLEDYDLKNIQDTKTILDEVFEKESSILQSGQTEGQRKEYRQRAVKASLETSEVLIALQGERLQKIQELANEIDQTETLKDAVDLNNRMLGEILLIQQTSLLLQAQYIRANQAIKYEYASSSQSSDDPNNNDSVAAFESMLGGAGNNYNNQVEDTQEKWGIEQSPIFE